MVLIRIMRKLYIGIEKLQNKGFMSLSLIWPNAIIMVKLLKGIINRQCIGIGNLQSKDFMLPSGG